MGYIIRGNITNCYNSGPVSSSYDTYVGGIAGYHYDGFGSYSCNITNCYNIGKTIVNDYSGNNYNGYGIAYLKGSSEIINSYYLDDTGTSSVGAVSLTEEQMLLSSMFVGFDFDNVWMQNIYADYPYPQLRNLPQNLKEPAKSVRIIFLPDKLTYFEGEALDLSGGVIEVFYASGSTSQVPMTVDMISGFDNTKVGKQTLTVTYEGVTDTFEVMINAVEVSFIELISLPTKTVYLKGEESFDPTGGKVKITYNNGENKIVELTANMVSGFDNTNVGKHLLTVTYENFTDTFEIEIIAYLVGDINEDSFVNESDVEYLLYHIFYPQQYPARQDCDFDGDGVVGDKDAEYLLYHVFFPDDYPLKNIDTN